MLAQKGPHVLSETADRQHMAEILNVCLLAGRLLLENGANTAVVEQNVDRLGRALGAERMEVFVTPGGLIVTLVRDHEHRTRIERVTHHGVQLARLARVLDVAGGAGSRTVAEVETSLLAIQRQPRRYGPWLTALAVGLGCAAFGVNLGGDAHDFGAAFLVAALAQLLRHHLATTRLGRLVSTFVVAAFATGLGLALADDLTAVAAILLLVPGAPLVSSTADLFRGDVLSGLARATSALVTILMASAGVWAIVLLQGRAEGSIELPGQESIWLASLMGALAAAGFAVLFDVPPRYLAGAALVGGVAVLARSLIPRFEVANLVAGLSIGVLAELLTRRRGAPFSLLAIPGYIPLVPGAVFFTGVLHLVAGHYVEGLASLVRAQIILISVALGMGLVPALLDTRQKAMV